MVGTGAHGRGRGRSKVGVHPTRATSVLDGHLQERVISWRLRIKVAKTLDVNVPGTCPRTDGCGLGGGQP